MEKIYRIAILLFVLSCSVAVFGQVAPADTLLRVESPSKVIITENEHGMHVIVEGTEENENYKASVFTEYSQDASVKSKKTYAGSWLDSQGDGIMSVRKGKKSAWWVSMSGVAFGLTNPLSQSPERGLQWSQSLEICWMSCLNVNYSFMRSSLSLGLGFDWRNYKISTIDKCMIANSEKGIEWSAYPEGVQPKGSRLKVFSLQLPLLYTWSVPKSSVSFKCGPIFNFNTYASLKSTYEDAVGNELEYFTKEISPRRFTVDFFGCVSYMRALGLYVRFSPMKVMNAPGLNFRPLTVGITIGI